MVDPDNFRINMDFGFKVKYKYLQQSFSVGFSDLLIIKWYTINSLFELAFIV